MLWIRRRLNKILIKLRITLRLTFIEIRISTATYLKLRALIKHWSLSWELRNKYLVNILLRSEKIN